MSMAKLTKVEAASIVTEVVLSAVCIKQPLWLTAADIGLTGANFIAHRYNAPIQVKASLGVASFAMGAIRTRHARITKQLGKRIVINLITTLPIISESLKK